MEYYIPFYVLKKNPDDVDDAQYFIRGTGSNKKFQCFKCERSKPSCDGAKNLKFAKKKDGLDVNSQYAIDHKFKYFKDTKKKRADGEEVSGSMHTMQGYAESTPSWDKIMDNDKLHDSNVLTEWPFNQNGVRMD